MSPQNQDRLDIDRYYPKAPPDEILQEDPPSDNHEAEAVIAKTLDALGLNRSFLPPDAEMNISLLLRQLDEPSWLVRVTALRTLERLDEAIPIQPVIGLLYDKAEPETVRAAAAAVLGKQKQKEALSALLAALHDAAWYVRTEAVLALGEMENDAAVALLLQRLRDKKEHTAVRTAAIQVLGRQKRIIPVNVLRSALESEDVLLREATVGAIGHLGGILPTKERYALLQKVRLNDEETIVREAARYILEQMEETDSREIQHIRNVERRALFRLRVLVSCCWACMLFYLGATAWNLSQQPYPLIKYTGNLPHNLVEAVSKVIAIIPFMPVDHSLPLYLLFVLLFCFFFFRLIVLTVSVWGSPVRRRRRRNETHRLWSIGIQTSLPISYPHEMSKLLQSCLSLLLVLAFLLLSMWVLSIWV